MAEQAKDKDFPVPVGLSNKYTGQPVFGVLFPEVLVVVADADDDDGDFERSCINCKDCKNVSIKSRCCGYNVGYGK